MSDNIFLYCLDEQFLKNLYIFLSFINDTLQDIGREMRIKWRNHKRNAENI